MDTDDLHKEYGVTELDWFLQQLVSTANKTDLEVPITLQVAGFFVSGFLVGGKKYFEGFAQDFADSLPVEPADADEFRATFSRLGNIYEDKNAVATTKPPHYIHLRDARFFGTANPQPVPNNKGVWWRGRLSQVGGFVLGTLESSQDLG